MTATDRLRAMLDERGIHWWAGDGELDRKTHWKSSGLTWEYFNDGNGDAWLGFLGACESDITPEQAIAATLGNGECENVAPDYLDFLCSVCGFVHYHSDENDTGDGNDWAFCPRCGKAVKR